MTAGTVLFLIDALIVALSWPLALHVFHYSARPLDVAGFALLDLLFLYALGFYRRDIVADTERANRRAPLSIALSVAAAMILSALLGETSGMRVAILALFCFTGSALLARFSFPLVRRNALFRPHLLVIGAGKRAFDLLWVLKSQGRHLQYDVTFVHQDQFGPIDTRLLDDPANHVVTISDNILDIAQRVFADEIVVAPDERRGMTLDSLISCRTAGYPVWQYMSFLEKEAGRIDIKRLDVDWVLYSEGFAVGPLGRGLKRLADILVSLVILTLSLVLLLPAMAAVWLEDRGPIFYAQNRVTLGGREFRILKLRTMRTDSEKTGATWAAAGDARVTRVGRFLRRSRIDELPQLINVLKGDMSLVGPRPERPEFIEDLAVQLPLYRERHAVRSGLTGWAQINYPYGASLDDARSKLSYDLYYVKKSGFFFDLLIIMQTLRVLIWPGVGGVR
ncbi:MAG TPA: TIGR03013 family XrtA/PEP-CTERM system glycosyltransferase [Rhizomicrobium sp.]|jgi:sugar transferase (PEP-CTERM system associated)|nr:TIGR03013 family XrtA/PEP-CTERM system glycosyltransferase [Rhizomicrobium sp.]